MKTAKNYPYPVAETVFTFRSKTLENIWNKVIKRELVDGRWRESWWGSHVYDYVYYRDAQTRVGEETKLEGLPGKALKYTGFSLLLSSLELKEEIFRVAKETNSDINELKVRKFLYEIGQAIRKA
jgi:hypothetical protein